jgi:succinate-semialdehyde dehydrogenase / glutarate-semialdehyde dehydrogenase
MIFESINPFDQKKIAEFETSSDSRTETKLNKSTTAFKDWKKTTLDFRCEFILKFAKILESKKTELAQMVSLEMGKTFTSATAEIEKCILTTKYYAENAEFLLAKKNVKTTAAESYFVFEPMGTILAIMPWNFPFWQALRFVIPNILAGNVVVLKHAPNVQMCAGKLESMFLEAGFEEGVFQNLIIDINQVEQVIAHQSIKGVTLTGSSQAGKSVAQIAGKHLKKTVLELGGSDPFIVLADADLKKAAYWACKSRFQNAGQTCIAAKRWIVVENVFEEFKNEVLKVIKTLKTGDPFDINTTYGPLARKDLVENLQIQKNKLINQGAQIIINGHIIDNLVSPTFLQISREISHNFSEEIFGPMACIIKAKDENEAINIANETSFGLGSSIWTSDLDKAKQLGKLINAGGVYINSMVKSDPALPFGGINNSGFGRELGAYGITEFTNIKTYWIEN